MLSVEAILAVELSPFDEQTALVRAELKSEVSLVLQGTVDDLFRIGGLSGDTEGAGGLAGGALQGLLLWSLQSGVVLPDMLEELDLEPRV